MKPLRSSYPIGHICNPATRYVPAVATDIRETFRREIKRRERAEYVAGEPKERGDGPEMVG